MRRLALYIQAVNDNKIDQYLIKFLTIHLYLNLQTVQ